MTARKKPEQAPEPEAADQPEQPAEQPAEPVYPVWFRHPGGALYAAANRGVADLYASRGWPVVPAEKAVAEVESGEQAAKAAQAKAASDAVDAAAEAERKAKEAAEKAAQAAAARQIIESAKLNVTVEGGAPAPTPEGDQVAVDENAGGQ